MSFRSRAHSKPVAPPRRRSSSLTRPSSGASNGYQSTNGRPYSIHGSTLNSQINFPLSSQSSGSANYLYGSNQNLRSGGGGASDYYGNDYRRNAGYGSVSNGTLKFPMTSMSTGASASSYSSPYKDRYSQNYSTPSSSSGYTSAYKDRGYYNPYTNYENGVTTASFSIPGPSSSTAMRDYNSRGSGNLTSTGLGGSSSNLMNAGQAIANLGRSQSLREHERKNRTRKHKEAAKNAVPDSAVPYDYDASASSLSNAQKSLSSASLHSEGYEVRFSCASRKFLFLN